MMTEAVKPWERDWSKARSYNLNNFEQKQISDFWEKEKKASPDNVKSELKPWEKYGQSQIADVTKIKGTHLFNADENVDSAKRVSGWWDALINSDVAVFGSSIAKTTTRSFIESGKGLGIILSWIGDNLKDNVALKQLEAVGKTSQILAGADKEAVKQQDFAGTFGEGFKMAGDFLHKWGDIILEDESLKPDEKVFAGNIIDNPSITRVASAAVSGIPSIMMMSGLNVLTRSPALAYFIMGGVDSSDIYEAAKKAGYDTTEVNKLYLSAMAGTAGVDLLLKPLERFLPASIKDKSLSRRLATKTINGLLEGSAEGAQTVWQNAVMKYGIDDTQELLEGVFESAIGGFGAGYFATGAFERAEKKLVDRGATKEEIAAMLDAAGYQINKDKTAINEEAFKIYKEGLGELEKIIKEQAGTPQAAEALRRKQEIDRIGIDIKDALINSGRSEEVSEQTAEFFKAAAFFGAKEMGVSPAEYMQTAFNGTITESEFFPVAEEVLPSDDILTKDFSEINAITSPAYDYAVSKGMTEAEADYASKAMLGWVAKESSAAGKTYQQYIDMILPEGKQNFAVDWINDLIERAKSDEDAKTQLDGYLAAADEAIETAPYVTAKSDAANVAEVNSDKPLMQYQEEKINAVDLSDIFKTSGNITEEMINDTLNGLLNKAMDTLSKPLQIQVTNENKAHIANSNLPLSNAQQKRHNTAITALEKVVNNATKNNKDGSVDLSHNKGKTLEHKQNEVERYVYFDSPVTINGENFNVELHTEQIKGQNPNLLNLYHIRVKRNPATNLIALQGFNNDNITNSDNIVKRFNQGEDKAIAGQVDDDIPFYQGQIAKQNDNVVLSINTKEETKDMTEEEFKQKMLETLWSFKNNKIYNDSLGADIEIRTSSVKKYKMFFADSNKRLIVPYIPELLKEATFKAEPSYTPKTENNIKNYWKSDVGIKIDNNLFFVHLTVKEDNRGNYFWDAQVKENAQLAESVTNTGAEERYSENSEDAISVSKKPNDVKRFYQSGLAENTRKKAREVKDALQKIADGAEEATVKNLRDDLETYGGTNDVTFVYGDEKKGLFHIADKHGGMKTLMKVLDAVVDGDITRYSAGNKTLVVAKNGYEAVLSLDENGKKKTWLLTGFDTKISPDAEREVRATLKATQHEPILSRQVLGAGLNDFNVTPKAENVNVFNQSEVNHQISDSVLYKNLPQNLKDAVDFIYNTPAVTEISGQEFQKDNVPLTDKVTAYYRKKYNGEVNNPKLGFVKLDKEGVKDSLGHGIGSKKAAAYVAVPEVIQKGFIFDEQMNWKGRGYDTVAMVAPIKIAGEDYICEVVVEKRPNRQGFYLHEVELSEKLADVFKTPTEGSTPTNSKLIIAEQIAKFNQNQQPYYQQNQPKGAYSPTEKIIYLFKGADESTFMHEMAHWFRGELERFNTDRSRKMLENVTKWENEEFNKRYKTEKINGRYVVKNQKGDLIIYDHNFSSAEEAQKYAENELFARGFEAYLREGNAPKPYLKTAFDKFRKWLRQIYRTAKDLNVDINDDIRRLFDEVIGNDEAEMYLNAPQTETMLERIEIAEALERARILDNVIAAGIAKSKEKKRRSPIKEIKEPGDKFWQDKIIPLSTRANRIAPRMKGKLREYEYTLKQRMRKYNSTIKTFSEKFKKFSEDDKVAFDYAAKNQYSEKLRELAKKYKCEEELQGVRDLLDSIHDEAKRVQIDMTYLPEYFPRQVKYLDALMEHLYGTEMASELRRAKREAGYDKMTPEEQKEFVNKFLQLRRGKGGLPGNTKKRNIDIITPDINEYYADSISALYRYAAKMANTLSLREFFGFEKENIDESIGAFVDELVENGEITTSQEKEVKDILLNRFKDVKGVSNAVLRESRNFAYAYLMNGVNSAITQFEDIYSSLYKAGVLNTVVSALLPKKKYNGKKLSYKELGLDRIAEEFTEQGFSANLVNNIFKINGLNLIDGFGKNTLINGVYRKYKNMASSEKGREKLRGLIEYMLEDKTEQAIDDFANDRVTDEVKLVLFNELSDMQPVSLSEMPAYYVSGGNGRVMYMLQSFFLKRLDVFRNECFDRIRNGDVAGGIYNLAQLSFLIMLCGMSKDVLLDLLYGRQIYLDDLVINNVLGIIGLSKYAMYRFRDDGPDALLVTFLPPVTPMITDMYRDIANQLLKKDNKDIKDWEVWKGIAPLVGRFYYWYFGGGRTKEEKKKKKKHKDWSVFE